jgi:tRNA (guanosine-2'-O-)-methyltransferase
MTLDKNSLASILTDNRRQRIEEVLGWRTYHITLALEDIYQSQNASATIRTAECFGIQRVFTIENKNSLTLNPDVVVGATNWVDMHRFNKPDNDNTTACINQLRSLGYRIIGTALTDDSLGIEELDLSSPVALLFGTELTGLSDIALNQADEKVKLPMFGFTESYNISVSVALALSHLIQRLHKSDINWRLSDDQRDELRLRWYEGHMKR